MQQHQQNHQNRKRRFQTFWYHARFQAKWPLQLCYVKFSAKGQSKCNGNGTAAFNAIEWRGNCCLTSCSFRFVALLYGAEAEMMLRSVAVALVVFEQGIQRDLEADQNLTYVLLTQIKQVIKCANLSNFFNIIFYEIIK